MSKIEYSCKRKKDFVTFSAIAMFCLICIFEIYLIAVLPIQMERQDTLHHQIQKQQMFTLAESIRKKATGIKPANRLQESEVHLVLACIDPISNYLRKHSTSLSRHQVAEINGYLLKLKRITDRWERNQFHFKEERLNVKPILRRIEQRVDRANAAEK